MKTIKTLTLIGLLALSGTTLAKVTMEDVNRDTEALNQGVPDQAAYKAKLESDWNQYNNPPNEVGQSETRHYVEFNYGLGTGKYIGLYIQCSFSGFTQPHSGDALFEKRVYKSGSADSSQRYKWYVTNKSEEANNTLRVMCY